MFNDYKKEKKIVIWLAAALIFTLFLFFIVVSFADGEADNFSRLSNWVDSSKFQAVFLTNGQVYFGKVTDVNSQTMVLEDIYYLRTAEDLQSPEDSGELTDSFSLIRLGKEIHGPENKMSINLDHVLFTENLGNDSRVMEAIREYEKR